METDNAGVNSAGRSSNDSQGSTGNASDVSSETLGSSEIDRPAELTGRGSEVASAADLNSKGGSPFDIHNNVDDDQDQEPSKQNQPVYTGSGLRTNPLPTAPNRCTKPEDFPNFSSTTQEKVKLALGVAKTVVSAFALAVSEGATAAAGSATGLASGVNDVVQTMNDSTDRGLKNATPDQIRCMDQAHQQQQEKLLERSMYTRSF